MLLRWLSHLYNGHKKGSLVPTETPLLIIIVIVITIVKGIIIFHINITIIHHHQLPRLINKEIIYMSKHWTTVTWKVVTCFVLIGSANSMYSLMLIFCWRWEEVLTKFSNTMTHSSVQTSSNLTIFMLKNRNALWFKFDKNRWKGQSDYK